MASAPFDSDRANDLIRAQAGFARVKAIRQTIAWTPDPNTRMAAAPDLTKSARFREATALLFDLGLPLNYLSTRVRRRT